MKRLGGLFALVMFTACFAPDLSVTPRGPLPKDNTVDPCAVARCDAPGRVCVEQPEGVATCVCGDGTREENGVCVDDPCEPNPCPVTAGQGSCVPSGTSFRCSCDAQFFDDDGAGGCTPRTAEVTLDELPGSSHDGETTTFTGRMQVKDPSGRPVFDAVVTMGEVEQRTDLEGRVAFPGLSIDVDTVFAVRRDGYHATAGRLRFADAGGGTERAVSLLPHTFLDDVLAESGGVVAHDGVAVRLPPRALQAGTAAPTLGAVDVAISTASAEALVDDGPLGLLTDGSVSPLEPLAMAAVSLSRGDATVVLDPVLGATLSLLLPPGADVAAGERLPLLHLDEERGLFVEASSCLVGMVPQARQREGRTLECSGLVRHFSTWLVARPAPSVCVHLAPRLSLPAHYELLELQLGIDRCAQTSAGFRCQPSTPAFSREVSPSVTEPLGGLCAVYGLHEEAAFSPVIRGALRDLRSGARVAFLEPLADVQTSPQRALRQSDLHELRYGDGLPLCRDTEHCSVVQQSVTIEYEPSFVDHDGDGHYVATGAAPARVSDCDDDDRTTYPGAPEVPCDGRDTDCDGVTDPYDGPVALSDVLSAGGDVASAWAGLCRAGCAIPDAESPGDAIDEDCDGSALDRDGDGLYRYGDRALLPEPWPSTWDCDDETPGVAGAVEVPGNLVDEDCDGVALDADGDGYVHTNHLSAFLALDDPSFVLGDCDDLDDEVHPGVAAASEAALAAYFAARTDGKVVRAATFCELLDERGRLRAAARAQFVDRNCDGEVTDLDGDGFPGPGQRGLGDGLPIDCDDLDPRVRPTLVDVDVNAGVAAGPGGEPVRCDAAGCRYTHMVCVPLTADERVDEGRCEVSPAVYGDEDCADGAGAFDDGCASQRCPPLLGAQSQCIATANRPDLGVCAVPRWEDRPPAQPFSFGAVWGPCDLSGVMPSCPEDTLCGAAISVYDDTYLEVLEALLAAEGQPKDLLSLPKDELGMCFPRCF
ncbi:MAG: MopE-related protein [Myxococcota bacterium]